MKTTNENRSRLSYGQQALWYLNQVEPASTAYHLGVCLRLTGALDEQALAAAWADIGMSHPQLRARFILRDGQPAIAISSLPAPLRIETGGATEVHRWWKETAVRPFALESEDPVRALLLRDANGPSHLLLCMHHIAGDLWSSATILRELSAGYEARVSGKAPSILREQKEYTEFAADEHAWLHGPQGLAAWNFWREHLNSVNTEPILARTCVDGLGGELDIVLVAAEARLIERCARERATTAYAVLLACYARLLGEETARDELIIGTPAAIRNRQGFRSTVGYLVNPVPMRCPVGGNDGDLVSTIAANARRALERRRFPFSALVERLRVVRNPEAPPLFQSMFAYQSLPRADLGLLPLALSGGGTHWNFGGGIVAETVAMPPFDAQFPLALTLGRQGDGFSGRLQYDGRSVAAADATRLAARFTQLVSELMAPRKCKWPERLENAFDDTAHRMPNAVAVRERGMELTYAQTKTRAEILAAGLDTALAGNAAPVAVQMPSCAEASILLLAILKSGRAFQPVDPTEPQIRRNAALRQTGACALVTPSGVDVGVLPEGVMALTPENLKTLPASGRRLSAPSQTAYLVSTSGSTGEPKAVEVGHDAVMNHARAMARIFDLTSRDRVLQFHTLAFDAAFEEIFPTWMAGASVVFEPKVRHFGTLAFLQTVEKCAISALNLPTSYWHALTAEAPGLRLQIPANLRLVVVGGEQASWKSYVAWRRLAPWCRWINTYGPTEATITALVHEPAPNASPRGILPIGKPIDGVTTVIVNDAGEQIDAGEGELLIGGKGLAMGYWGDPGMTARKFVMREARRFYRTGDRVKLRRDGNFQYIGRLDRQLKIRGYRVDPQEIEHALREYCGVTDTVVSAQNIEGELNLTAWIVRANGRPTEREVRSHLSGRFPSHMIPSRVTFVAQIPRKPSGKVDATALVQPTRSHVDHGGPTHLAILFSELLGHKVGPRDDFFLSGGHSLLAIKLLGRVEAHYGARISVSDFIAAPTATDLWKRVKKAPSAQPAVIEDAIPAEVPVSAQQSRALLGHCMGSPSLGNIVLVFRVNQGLDTAALTRSLETVARRNFLLRCGFFENGKGVVLREVSERPRLERRVLGGKRSVVDLARREGRKPFVLDGRRPWFRMLVVFTGRRNSHLIVITHHAVADGWACELFLNDLRGEDDRGRVDYRSYALHQARWLQSPAARKQAAFWKARLAGAEAPRLPFRRPSLATSWQAERYELTVPRRLSRDLRGVAGMYGTTPFALAMACFKALVHRYNGQQDILLGTVVSNRSSDQSVRGPLQNPALIRDSVTADMPMRMLARRVAHSLSEAEANGALPFEQVIREALPDRPFASDGGIQFLSHDRAFPGLQLGSASLEPVELPVDESPFELSIAVSAGTSCLKLAFEYRPGVYPSSGIKHLARQYAALLHSVAANPHARVKELNMTPATELREFDQRLTAVHHPCLELLHQGFDARAQKNPDAIAIAGAGRRLTYGELDSMSQSTAGALIGGGLKAGGLVAVMLKKGWEQIVACLAVLKAGGVYVPVDPTLPAARLKVLFGQGEFHGAIVAEGAPQDTPWLMDLRSRVTINSAAPRGLGRIRTKPDSLAYIIFTSGSTGVPKGVMTSHRAAMTTIQEISRRFRVGQSDRVLAVSSLGFDLSVFDMFGTLRAGGRIVMPATHDPKEWIELIRREKVTVWNSVPCLFELLLDEAAGRRHLLEPLRLILLSGDFICPALARRARGLLPRTRLVCLGGATEAGIWSIAHEVKADPPASRSVPYGRALRGQEMFVLDAALNHCATGVAGELFISGAALAEGYWHNKLETRRRFVRHPRRHIRLYRTGDQGRYLDNGEIEILGRLDAQVKVNGVRLELGEVEAALCSAPTIRQAVAEARIDQTGPTRLIAFVAAPPGTDASVVSAHMRTILPTALLPSAYVLLDRLPLTSTGKVDRAALRSMSVSAPGNNGASPTDPTDPTERAIAKIWSVLLGGVAVGVEQDFFALGGHSLLAIQMLQRVRSRFAVDLPLSLILDHPTVRGLAMAVDAAADRAPQPGLPRRATTEFERDSEPVMSKPVHRTQPNPNAVLLTGATGHLGSALLVELLERTTCRIYCLVRSASREEGEARLLKVLRPHDIPADLMQRVVTIPGDLSREQFGLDASAFAALAGEIQAVYHCAAEVNFIASYEKLAASNVGGVREIVRLASAADAPLHYVSSVAVFPYGGGRIVREDDDIAAVTMLTGGYAQSKWASERLVWKAIAQGLRAVIYRPAQIVGGHADGPRHDLFHHILRACNILHAVPDIDATIDMVTPEYAASAIRCISDQRSSEGSAFHLVHPEPMSLRDFVELFPTPLPLVALENWLGRLRREAERSDDPSLRFVSMLAQGLERADVTPPGFDCTGTVARLRGTGISCPPLDRQFIQRALALPQTICGAVLSEKAA